MKLIKYTLVLFALILLQVNVKAQFAITTTGTTYTWDFNSLPTSSTPWTNNSTIPNFYAAVTTTYTITTLNASTGSSNTGALYNFGVSGDADRALGSICSGTTGGFAYSLRLVNNTGVALSALNISYKGEQWRAANAASQKLQFYYLVSSSPVTTFNATSAGFTTFTSLDFTCTNLTSTGIALDGNANSSLVTGTITTPIQAGDEIIIKWIDINDTGSDHGLSIDDLNISAVSAVTTPEINVKQNTTNVLNNGTYNFGTTPDGSTLTSVFTIENIGTAPLQVTSSTFTGSSDFVVNTTLPLTISASSSATFSVTFAPTSVGTLSATNAFANDDSDENPYTINFVGNSIAAIPEINVTQNTNTILSGSTYTFAPILAGNTSVATFTIQNIGGATLNITSAIFAGNSEFAVTSDYTTPFSIAYGDFATFTATFSPSVVNTYSASITLSNDDSDENPYIVNFYGEATAPFSEINIKQSSTSYANGTTYNYGNKAISSTTDISFTIENLGNSVLNISTYTLSGSEYSLQGAMPTSVNAGATADFTVRFVPTSATTFAGSISITNNDGNENPYVINFAGTGIIAPSEINVKESGINYFTGTTYDYANRAVGTNSDVTFTIENNDSGVLLISTHTLTGSAYSIVGTIPSSINGNSTANFTLRFSPLTAVAYTGALTLVNNDASESNYVINLTGNGIALPATPSLKINEIMANPTSGSDWFEIYNPGSTAVNLSGLYVSNSSLTKYKFVNGSPSIPAGGFVQVMANNGGQISPLEVNFTLSNTDEVFLYSYDGTTVVDQLAVTDAVAGQSQGRVTDGGTEFMSFSTATPGATNTAGIGVVSVRELNMSQKLILAPNPSSSVFTITYNNSNNEKTFAYRIIDIAGKEVLSGNTNATSGLNIYPVNVTSIAKGLYFVECVVGNEKVTSKIVVE